MSSLSTRALHAAHPIIQGLIVLNLLYGAGIALLLISSFFIDGWPWRPLGFDLAKMHPLAPLGLRAIVVIGIAGAAIVHRILRRLLAIVGTVRDGDPFIADNAQRLNVIAWSVLAIEVSRICVWAIALAVWEPGKVSGFSFAPWLAILLLFVLSGVFAHGARLRADLEGTV